MRTPKNLPIATFALIFGLALMLSTPSTATVPIPPTIKKVVSFIYVPDADGKSVSCGTGFHIGLKDPDSDRYATYLVTAKHVLADPSNQGRLSQQVSVRLDLKAGGTRSEEVTLVENGPGKNVFQHPDPSVDIALIPFVFDPVKVDHLFMPAESFITDKQEAGRPLREGMDVFFVGLFKPLMQAKRNCPIVRYGCLALVPDDPLPLDLASGDLLLVETFSFPGNSGAPVFLYLGPDQVPGMMLVTEDHGPKLLGVMNGFFPSLLEQGKTPDGKLITTQNNSGIAAITPADKILEILHSDELTKLRGW